ncbi:MAG: BatA domain-containing protein [Mariniblastus sp.]|nr:BatA domain-containing protein [Mariniblastus sp.]
MSALAWLFGLGALTIAFPFLLHLIRQTPKGQTEFSSLLFLKPSPPSLTRRSRLENILLLLLRALAIALIAIAFMRPFFRGQNSLSEYEVANRRIAILIDTSASMRRSGLWDQAERQIEKVLNGLEKGDDVSLIAFDATARTVVDFNDQLDDSLSARADSIRKGFKTLDPSWQRSDLGNAMVTVADNLDVWRDSQRVEGAQATVAKLQMVVVSDLQKGSNLDSLQAYQWPATVFVEFYSVVAEDPTNATLQLLAATSDESDSGLRIRVRNSEESLVDQFFVNWTNGTSAESLPFFVPPGTSRVMQIPPEQNLNNQVFELSGDTEVFDNEYFVAPIEQQTLRVDYLGSDTPDNPEGLQYYLRRGLVESPTRRVVVRQLEPGDSLADAAIGSVALTVMTSPVDEIRRDEIDEYLKAGGTLFVILSNAETVSFSQDWIGGRLKTQSGKPRRSKNDYQMLAEIDFSSRLFQLFANPRYNDFTNIRFWNHQSVEIVDPQAVVLARFENDDPAVWKLDGSDRGCVYVMASGWNPQQSQLALSTKFVPLINGLVEIAADLPELDKSYTVGETIVIPRAESGSRRRQMVKPDGTREAVATDAGVFSETDQPGIYRLISDGGDSVGGDSSADAGRSGKEEVLFAVNVNRSESSTTAIPLEQIEMFSVNVGEQETAASERAQMRSMLDRDIEDRQKIWKWLIVAAILLLMFETWLAARTSSRSKLSNGETVAVETGGELV